MGDAPDAYMAAAFPVGCGFVGLAQSTGWRLPFEESTFSGADPALAARLPPKGIQHLAMPRSSPMARALSPAVRIDEDAAGEIAVPCMPEDGCGEAGGGKAGGGDVFLRRGDRLHQP